MSSMILLVDECRFVVAPQKIEKLPHFVLPTLPEAIPPEPISIGLSPTWRRDRCVIPISSSRSKWRGFVGRKINVRGFAQDCLITSVFHKYDDEWAQIFHERHGFLYRKTKQLLLKDLVP